MNFSGHVVDMFIVAYLTIELHIEKTIFHYTN